MIKNPPAVMTPDLTVETSGVERVMDKANRNAVATQERRPLPELLRAREAAASAAPPSPAQRLVVLVPAAALDEAALSQRVWALALPRQLTVLYLGLCWGPDMEWRTRRQLTTLAALTRDDQIHVETCLEWDRDWVRALRSVLQPGDLVVCHAEQTAAGWGHTQSLAQVLPNALGAPVCVLSGICQDAPASPPSLARSLFHWSVALTTLAAFFWLQVQIQQLLQGGPQMLLLSLSVVVELGLIALWHQYTSSR